GVHPRGSASRGVAMTEPAIRVSRGWLALREPADAAARALDLVDCLREVPPATGHWVIHDLGCGTGAMARWLAPLLCGAQHWGLPDRDAAVVEAAAAAPRGRAADGAGVSLEARRCDVTRLNPGDVAEATLITASSLLDLLTEEDLTRLIGLCAGSSCPV